MPIALELAFPRVWLGAKTHSVFAPVVVSAPANIFWLVIVLPVLVLWCIEHGKVLCNYLSKGKNASKTTEVGIVEENKMTNLTKMTDFMR